MLRLSGCIFILVSMTFSAMADEHAAEHQACPESFYSVPVYPQSKLCLRFADELPATMTYHAQANMQQVQDYYLAELGQPLKSTSIKGRQLLAYAQGQHTIVISADGGGSQVDILIKSTD